MEENTLVTGRIGPALFKFAIPFLVANILQALYGAVDMFVVGRYADSAALSAVSVGSQVMQTFTVLLMGLTTGGTVLIGQRVGARDGKGAANAVGVMVVLFSAVAVLLTAGMFFTSAPFVHLLQTPEEAVPHAISYVSICVLGIPFITGYNTVASIFRGLGDSKRPMICIAAACMINIAGDFLLIGALRMGAAGAAIATVAAQACSFVVALALLVRQGLPFPFSRSDIRFHGPEAGRILKVGLPLCLQDVLVNMSFLIITAIINGMGLVASAAVGVVGRVTSFAFLPTGAFSSGVATMAAQNIGAGKPDRALKSLWTAIGFSLVFSTLFCAYSQFWPETLVRIFTSDSAVIAAGAQYLRADAYDAVLTAFVFCFNSYFSACGNSMVSMIHSLIATFLVRVPVSWLVSRMAVPSLFGIGLAAPAASLFSIVVCFGYFTYLRRKAGDSPLA
ncbi:MAG: MATE family efflux transporter [Clostridia bacterium]|nr:MATE family efflux transporter [Clostridia bacterium]